MQNLKLYSYLNHLYSGRYSELFIKTDNLILYQSYFYERKRATIAKRLRARTFAIVKLEERELNGEQ